MYALSLGTMSIWVFIDKGFFSGVTLLSHQNHHSQQHHFMELSSDAHWITMNASGKRRRHTGRDRNLPINMNIITIIIVVSTFQLSKTPSKRTRSAERPWTECGLRLRFSYVPQQALRLWLRRPTTVYVKPESAICDGVTAFRLRNLLWKNSTCGWLVPRMWRMIKHSINDDKRERNDQNWSQKI